MYRCKHKNCIYASGTHGLQTCDYYLITGKHREQDPPNCPHYTTGKRKRVCTLPFPDKPITYET